jgi:catechol 2,3-dioxygenase-like lactoylglutathione lyase family enzyme
MALDLYAGIRVSDYETADAWYERLLGAEPADGNEIGFGGAID